LRRRDTLVYLVQLVFVAFLVRSIVFSRCQTRKTR
jgi:hypothetical protein